MSGALADDAAPAMVRIGDLWVPAADRERYAHLQLISGMPDLDVSKIRATFAYCRSFGIAVDVGAHIGATARALAARFDEVIAFEVVPSTFAVLERNLAEHANVTLENLALYDREAELRFEYAGWHTQLTRILFDGEALELPDTETVGPYRARPLDSFGLDGVSLIKIDVEGSELEVLRGARGTLLGSRPTVLVEQGGNDAKFHGRPRDEASRYLEALGMVRVTAFPYGKDRLFVWP